MATLSAKQKAFVREYLLSGNASDAHRKAGYTGQNHDVNGPRMLGHAGIAAEIAKGRAKMEAKAEAEFNLRLDDVLAKLAQIATVDRTRLTAHRRGACRYCHGVEHRYQWKTPREFSEAVELHMLKGEAYAANHPAPEMEGGYGYKITNPPKPDCPECAGLGISYTVFADTDAMTDAEKIVFEGVKETKDGIQYVMSDRLQALLAIAKHLGLADKARDGAIDGFSRALQEIAQRASSMPIRGSLQPRSRVINAPQDDEDDENVDP